MVLEPCTPCVERIQDLLAGNSEAGTAAHRVTAALGAQAMGGKGAASSAG